MLLGIVILTFFTAFIVLYLLFTTYLPSNHDVTMRLKSLDALTYARTDIEEELAKPFAQRVLAPFSGSMATILMRFTPRAVRKMAVDKLEKSGGLYGLNPESFLLLWGFVSTLFPAVVIFWMLFLQAPVRVTIGLALLAFAIGTILPLLVINQKITSRKKTIQKDLPDVLDILTVSVEAGLGFDGALSKLAEKMKGALVDEFVRVLQEMRIGVTRREALQALKTRCDVADLSLFATSLVQADQLGVSIGNVLRVQSAGMRQKRRQRAEEQAKKAPIKMMLPLVIFIFPTIFVILLGPALIQIMAAFAAR